MSGEYFEASSNWYQHRRGPDRPHCGDRGNHRGIGVELVVPRDDVRVCEPCRHIECEPFSCAGKKFRRGEEGSIVQGVVSHAISVALTGDHTLK